MAGDKAKTALLAIVTANNMTCAIRAASLSTQFKAHRKTQCFARPQGKHGTPTHTGKQR